MFQKIKGDVYLMSHFTHTPPSSNITLITGEVWLIAGYY